MRRESDKRLDPRLTDRRTPNTNTVSVTWIMASHVPIQLAHASKRAVGSMPHKNLCLFSVQSPPMGTLSPQTLL